ncbi:MAG: DEAD/DEAH box helicase family protein [Fusobacterium sp.]
MSLREVVIKPEYRTLSDNMITEFYIPLLKESIIYKRAVGFFSASSLIEISKGIGELVKNNGKIQIVASPRLQERDVEAIKEGYELRDTIIERILIDELQDPIDKYDKKRLNLLAYLIAEGILDIKIAFTGNKNGIGMYHEKMGIFEDKLGNKVCFSGSMNETITAMKINYETIDVFISWKDEERVKLKNKAFSNIWNNNESNIEVIDFPNLKAEIIKKYKIEEPDYEIDIKEKEEKEQAFLINEPEIESKPRNVPTIPKNFEFYDYQIEAIENWKKNNYRGIFDMATGTGKTYTGLGALVDLYEKCRGTLVVIIVCPYQHLVEQWVEDIKLFNIEPIIGYSSSKQKNWKQKLQRVIKYKNLNLHIQDFVCLICTNATFSSKFVQEQLSKLKENIFLLVDEAHNFGSNKLSQILNEKYAYRLALSATLERHGDEEGTQKLYDFFGEKCIEYDLQRAIEEGKLTPYRYYPIVVYLNEEELQKYNELSEEINKNLIQDSNGKTKLSKYGEILAIKRARVIAGAQSKLSALRKEMVKYKDDNFILVYCGATNVLKENKDETDIVAEDIRQIDEVTKILGNEFGMRVSQFTSKESAEERKRITENFKNGENLQGIVAIKCLDEGVNIPGIKTAFILASTTNPKEYIQRRGRVLRLFKGKEYAEIYDFVTLPRELENILNYTQYEIKNDIVLVKKEISRMKEFGKLALNSSESLRLIRELKKEYRLEGEA